MHFLTRRAIITGAQPVGPMRWEGAQRLELDISSLQSLLCLSENASQGEARAVFWDDGRALSSTPLGRIPRP